MIRLPNPEGGLLIDGVNYNRRAFAPTNLMGLLPQPDERGTNLVVPDLHGSQPLPTLLAETQVVLPWAVCGAFTPDDEQVFGTSSDYWRQTKLNWMHLRSAIFGPYDDGPSSAVTRELAWIGTDTDDVVFEGAVQLSAPKTGRTLEGVGFGVTGVILLATMRVRIPAGELSMTAGS